MNSLDYYHLSELMQLFLRTMLLFYHQVPEYFLTNQKLLLVCAYYQDY